MSANKLAVLWIDWYAYHLARYKALTENSSFAGRVAGIELVGGAGVHGGFLFRQERRGQLSVMTLFPGAGWAEVPQLKASAAVWKALDSLNPDAVLVPGYYTLPGLAAAVWAKTHAKRSILMSESTRDDHQRQTVREWCKACMIRMLFDRAVVGGKPHVRYLASLGFPLDRIAQNYDTVDNRFFSQGTAQLRCNSSPADHGLPQRYFLYVGRLAEEKNVARLIDEFAAHARCGSGWSLVIAGDGPLKTALGEHAMASGFASQIHFCGMKTADGLLPYYAFAGCFVLPSVREPWGLVVNEAMASGLPVIVSSRCGCAEDLVQNGENGYLFDPSARGALRLQLDRIVALSVPARERMGQRSHEIISRYSPEHWANSVADCVAL